MNRSATSYAYLVSVACFVVILNLMSWRYNVSHPDRLLDVTFLVLAAALMNRLQVRIDKGRLSMSGIVLAAAALLTTPLDATLIGIASSAFVIRRGSYPILANTVFTAAASCAASILANVLRAQGELGIGNRLLVLALCFLVDLILVALAFRIRNGESIRSVLKHNFTPSFYLAFGYFGLAALLISYVLDGSLLGYFLATIVCILALALTDTISGRRVRRVLESELSDADRHLFHSRAVEGVVHNLRNHMANAVGYLKEVD
ncbi:MAG TPA: hypothetical protein VK256_12130, partial [Candidatus Eisenbacteria bacterium]|nr:hypothetical protein [Candidatus Eisenbacteria bacterium]